MALPGSCSASIRIDHLVSTTSPTLQLPHHDANSHGELSSEDYDAPNLSKDEKEAYRVDWEPNDPENPRNWKTAYKGWLTFQLGMLALAASLGSSIISPANNAISAYIHVSPQVATLSLSLYVLGFAFGPLLWAPISEVSMAYGEVFCACTPNADWPQVWGRKVSLLPAMFCLGLFSIGTATCKTPAAIFITRFFGGVFGSAPVSNVSAALGDIWAPKARGTAVTFYAVCVTGGPTLGPGEPQMAYWPRHLRLIDYSHWIVSHRQPSWMALDRIHRSNMGLHHLHPGRLRIA